MEEDTLKQKNEKNEIHAFSALNYGLMFAAGIDNNIDIPMVNKEYGKKLPQKINPEFTALFIILFDTL